MNPPWCSLTAANGDFFLCSLTAVVLEECYFESGKCDWTSPHANSKWKLFPGTKSLKHFSKLKYLRKEAQYCEQQLSFFVIDLLFLVTKNNR